MSAKRRSATIAGAGLAGSLLAIYLARRGIAVTVYERRADPRVAGYVGGRSINLALAERGMHALRLAGLEQAVLEQAVMMRGRMVHFDDGRVELQRYGRDDSEVIWSVSRGALNMTLLDAAERAGARIEFEQRLGAVDFANDRITLHDERSGGTRELQVETIIGCDGAGSALREALAKEHDLGERFEPLGHGYKELEIPASHGASIERHALHIWPRTNYMCIALPNADGSWTVTLFLPNEGEPSFTSVGDADAALRLFARDFPDALPLMPTLAGDYAANPVGLLGTLRLERWHLDHRALLVGDAAHAIVPFHGQGMNAAFEDCVELDALVGEGGSWQDAYEAFEQRRRPNTEAIADMALENYVEMRDRVDDADFLLRRALERTLAERHRGVFVPRYAMVMFRRTPYAVAQRRGAIQAEILAEATAGARGLDDVDLARADALVRERLTPLER